MRKLTSKELREAWLTFFESKGHLRVESKSLIPKNDQSLLWINSGVATLKDYFSGNKKPLKNRITNSQKSIRTNDIENVGTTSRHHTFFEMLGNFSIGDYSKSKAIEFAYEFLIEILEIEKNKLYITYFQDDKETYNKWLSVGVDPYHLIPGNKEMNFWDMGIGPCGPDTEIFFDRGPKFDNRGIELIKQDLENDRFIEIWNIVFSELNNDGEGNYTELTQKNIDTGAGLERICSILQDAYTNFDTDLFLPIINKIKEMSKKTYDLEAYFTREKEQVKINKLFQIIADHMRAIVNTIQDGVEPSNTFRGYIIRRLIRRAYRAGIKLGIKSKTFLYTLTETVYKSLPFFIDVDKVCKIIQKEEEYFAKTIKQGEKLLKNSIVLGREFEFSVAFKLFETFGFPIELTQEILKEKNIKLDISKFEEYQQKHIEISRNKVRPGMPKQIISLQKIKNKVSKFVGYGTTQIGSKNIEKVNSEVIFMFDEKQEVKRIDGVGFVVFSITPFYATSGGQKHDVGFIYQNDKKININDVFKDKFGNNIHKINGHLTSGHVSLEVNHNVRNGLMRNHSATHLVFKALREVFGRSKIKQLGSDNNEDRLRFDFPCDIKPTEEKIQKIEDLVNGYINEGVEREYIVTNFNKAKEMNAIMTPNEEDSFSKKVRIVKFGNITVDLCGGTHVSNTMNIEKFKIKFIEKKGSGIFRLEAITSKKDVYEYVQSELLKFGKEIEIIANKNLKLDKNYLINKKKPTSIKYAKKLINNLREDNKKLLKINSKIKIPDVKLKKGLYIDINFKNPTQVKNIAIGLREKYPKGTFVIASKTNKAIIAIASKTKNSNKILQSIFSATNGKGGGNTLFAQGSCDLVKDFSKIIKQSLK